MDMKKIIYGIIAIATLLGTVSCEGFLTSTDSSFQSKEYQFSNYDRTKQVANNVYSYIRSYFDDVNGTMREAATDNAIYTWEDNAIKTFYDGSWSANNTIDNVWSHYYKGIRAANYYLENCPEGFEGAEYTDHYNQYMKELQTYKYEIRLLRAWFHFELVKRYNRIIIADRCFEAEEINDQEPVSYENAINWIVSEIDSVLELDENGEPLLPYSFQGSISGEIGRVTRGMAMALKARALLYLASPLNNPDNMPDLWWNAFLAAYDFVNDAKFTYVLKDESIFNDEKASDLIFGMYLSQSSSFEEANFPYGFNGVYGGICPTQNLAGAFGKKDGSAFDWNRDADLRLAYSKRDQRMAQTLMGNGTTFQGEALQTYYGGTSGKPKEGATPTSYYLKKFVQTQTVLVGNTQKYPHVVPFFRYAEVWLNYAEALFEATGNPTAKGKINGTLVSTSPLDAVNKVRSRSNLSSLPKTITADEFRKALRNERRLEFAFEDQRFWDIRRWMIGPETTDIYGLKLVDGNEDGAIDPEEMTVELIQSRKWDDKYYFYPIPDSELFKNHNLIQNPGWE